jgi:hypothetical protein
MDLIILCLLIYSACTWRRRPPKPRWMKNPERALAAYKQYAKKRGYHIS